MPTRKTRSSAKRAKKPTATTKKAKRAAAPAKKKRAAAAPRKRAAASPPSSPSKGVSKAATASARPAGAGPILRGLPVLWQHAGAGQAIGIHVDDDEVWGGWTTGDVIVCNHAGEILRRWKLPAGVDALVADDAWRYAGCHDGKVYDLTGRVPRVAYEIESGARIHWVDVYRGNLCASDAKGCLTVVDADGKLIFEYGKKNGEKGWMARADSTGVYLGNGEGVTKVGWNGEKIWHTKTEWVGFGWQESDRVIAFVGAWLREKAAVVSLDKATGKILATGSCWSTAKHYNVQNSAAACAAGPEGKVMYGGTCDTLFAFDEHGKLLWETPTRVGATCSMHYHNGKLYVVTHTGHLAALDVSEAAVAEAMAKAPSMAQARSLEQVAVTERVVADVDTNAGEKGVVVECFKDGAKVRVRVISAGYRSDWFCQFPRDIREEGARYLVDEVREAAQGGFYRVLGDIRRLREQPS